MNFDQLPRVQYDLIRLGGGLDQVTPTLSLPSALTFTGKTITGEYQKLPSDLVEDNDVPEMPSHLHMAIVYKAMQFYGLYEAAPEVLSKGNTEFSRLMNQLEREQLPELYLGNPLA